MSKTTMLFITISLLFVGMTFGKQVAPPETSVIEFQTKLGKVTFLHSMHSSLSFTKCTTCHHTFEGEGDIKSCHDCHDKDAQGVPGAKEVFHLRCIGCHEYTAQGGERAGPIKTKCLLCHIR